MLLDLARPVFGPPGRSGTGASPPAKSTLASSGWTSAQSDPLSSGTALVTDAARFDLTVGRQGLVGVRAPTRVGLDREVLLRSVGRLGAGVGISTLGSRAIGGGGPSDTEPALARLWVRATGWTGAEPDAGYGLEWTVDDPAAGVRLVEKLTGNPTLVALATLAGDAPRRGDQIRVIAEGTRFRARWWGPAATEPATWQLDYTDVGFVGSAGLVGLSLAGADVADLGPTTLSLVDWQSNHVGLDGYSITLTGSGARSLTELSGTGASTALVDLTSTGRKHARGTGTSTALVDLTAAGAAAAAGTGASTALVDLTSTGRKHARGTGTSTALVDLSGTGLAVGETPALSGTGASTALVDLTATGRKHARGTGASTALVGLTRSGRKRGRGRGTTGLLVDLTSTGVGQILGVGLTALLVDLTGTGRKRTRGTGATAVVVVLGVRGGQHSFQSGTSTLEVGLGATGRKRGRGRGVGVPELVDLSGIGEKGGRGRSIGAVELVDLSSAGTKHGLGLGASAVLDALLGTPLGIKHAMGVGAMASIVTISLRPVTSDVVRFYITVLGRTQRTAVTGRTQQTAVEGDVVRIYT